MGLNHGGGPSLGERSSGHPSWMPAWELVGLIAAIIVFVCASTSFALQVPAFHSTDERAHLGYAHAIADGHLPEIDDRPDIPTEATVWRDVVTGKSRTDSYRTVWVANHPPLHYVLVAPLIWLSTAAGRTDGGVMYMRFANIAFACAGIAFTYLLAVQLTGGERRSGLAAASLVALIPRGHFEFAQGFNDGLSFAATTAVVWAAVRYLRHGHSSSGLLVLGATVAVAAGSRAAAMIVAVAVVAVVSVVRLITHGGTVRLRARAAALTAIGGLAPAAVLFGWFYLRNVSLYGDIGASSYLLERFERSPVGTPLGLFTRGHMWVRIYQELPIKSLLTMRAAPPATIVANVVAVLTAIGLAIGAVTRRGLAGSARRRSLQPSVSALAVCAVVVLVVATTIVQHTSGGGVATSRYVFPALGVLAGLFAIGLDRLMGLLPVIVVATLGLWSARFLPGRILSEIEQAGVTPAALSGVSKAVLSGLSIVCVVVLIAILFATRRSAAADAAA